jgi:hypothetical protein
MAHADDLRLRTARCGLSLLELMLALSLTGVVMVVISIAIDLHLRTLERGRSDVERAQLARAVLRHIAKDLQNTVWYEPLDLSGLQNLAITSEAGDLLDAAEEFEAAAGGESEDTEGETGNPGADDEDASGGDMTNPSGSGGGAAAGDDLTLDDDLLGDTDLLGDMALTDDLGLTENTTDIAGSLQPASVPGLYGNQSELQVDISRLPRVDQYSAVATDSTQSQVIDIPSDVKTVAYFLQASDEADPGAMLSGAAITGVAGLARREQDRAIASWAAEDGGLEAGDHSGSLLAPEVNYLEFRYFDGLDWYTEWDSEQMESLPVAVEITIGLDPAFGVDPATLDAAEITEAAAAEQQQELYRMVVHLPVAKPAELEESTELGLDVMGDLGL